MRVLIACEESQIVTKAFREKGHEAYSNDIQECSGGHPEWHLKMDSLEAVKLMEWDLMIAHPPCTYLSYAGIGYFNVQKWGEKAIERARLRDEALDFFLKLWDAPIPKICIENPRGFPMTVVRPAQMIHPWYFGDGHKKMTCLWLKNLSRLNGRLDIATNPRKHEPQPIRIDNTTRAKKRYFTDGASRDPKIRSKTFPGIAAAMAAQWG